MGRFGSELSSAGRRLDPRRLLAAASPERSAIPRPPGGLQGLGAGLAVLAAVGVADWAYGMEVDLTGTYVLGPLVTALLGWPLATAIVGVAALALSIVSGIWWNDTIGTLSWDLRTAAVIVASAIGVIASMARSRASLGVRRLMILESIGQIADGSRSLNETLERVKEILVPEFADCCTIDVIAEGTVTRVAAKASGPRADEVEKLLMTRSPSVPDWLVSPWVPAQQRQPRFLPRMKDHHLRELAQDAEDLEQLRSLGPRSSMTVPMLARGETLGTLTVITAWSGRRYDRTDLAFARALVGRLALVLDISGLFSDLQSVQRRMDTVMEILAEAVVVHGTGGELIYANRASAELFGFDSPEDLIATRTPDLRTRFELRDEGGRPLADFDLGHQRTLAGESAGPRLIRAGLREGGEERWLQTTSRPILGPGGRPLYAVTTIEDLTAIKRAEFEARILAATAELLASSRDSRETLARLAHLVVPQLADWCSVNLPGEDGLIEQVEIARIEAAAAELEADGSAIAAVLRSGKSQLVAEADSMILVPMSAGEEAVGVLALVNGERSRSFTEEDLALAEEIGRRAGVAVAGARLAEERARIAETLQRDLLPPELPRIGGWELAAMYRPAGLEVQVGGDFYDAFETSTGWMLMIGDVAGHGVDAASLTALARYTIRAAAALTGNAVIALRQLNEAMWQRPSVSLCSVVLIGLGADPNDADIEVTVAGHPLPVLIRSQGEVGRAGVAGSLLGAFEDGTWETDRVRLAPDDRLVLFTDGVTEARRGSERFGEERLLRRISGTGSTGSTIATIQAALEGFSDGAPADDAAVLVLQRGDPGALFGGRRDAAAAEASPAP